MSTGFNSVAAVILEDFVKIASNGELSERKSQYILKGTVIITGIICMAIVYVLENFISVMQMAFSLQGVTRGPIAGMFVTGMLIPWVNTKGMFAGVVAGIAFTSWLAFGTQAAIASGGIIFPEKPVSVEGCSYNFTTNISAVPANLETEDVLPIYHISYMWYTTIGLLITVAVSVMVSFVTGSTDPATVDPRFISPCLRRYLPPYRGSQASYKGIDLKIFDSEERKNLTSGHDLPDNKLR